MKRIEKNFSKKKGLNIWRAQCIAYEYDENMTFKLVTHKIGYYQK